MFASENLPVIRAWKPETLAAPLEIVLDIAARIPSLSRALIVLTPHGRDLLADAEHDLLWHRFGLPVFEQLRGYDGRVIARECEIHDGLHCDTSDLPAGEYDRHLCDCGLETPRLKKLLKPKARTAAA